MQVLFTLNLRHFARVPLDIVQDTSLTKWQQKSTLPDFISEILRSGDRSYIVLIIGHFI